MSTYAEQKYGLQLKVIMWQSDQSNKIGFLPCSSCVNRTVWLHHEDINEIYIEKARSEQHKNASCYFERILKATPYKTAVIRLPATHLTNQTSKRRHAKHCWRSKDKLISCQYDNNNDKQLRQFFIYTFAHAIKYN